MATKNLQSLVLHVARTSDRATGLESKVRFGAMGDNTAQAFSFPWHPQTGPNPIGPMPDVSRPDYSMDASVRRAGRSASVGALSGRVGCARLLAKSTRG